MSDRHEADLAERLGGKVSRGSGNQWASPMDGRHAALETPYAFAWEGKSTRGKGISVTRAMWGKALLQAHGERPMLALRWYDSDRLDVHADLVVLDLDDFEEMRDAAIKAHEAGLT